MANRLITWSRPVYRPPGDALLWLPMRSQPIGAYPLATWNGSDPAASFSALYATVSNVGSPTVTPPYSQYALKVRANTSSNNYAYARWYLTGSGMYKYRNVDHTITGYSYAPNSNTYRQALAASDGSWVTSRVTLSASESWARYTATKRNSNTTSTISAYGLVLDTPVTDADDELYVDNVTWTVPYIIDGSVNKRAVYPCCGKGSLGYTFDGTDDHIALGNTDFIGTGDITVILWLKLTDAGDTYFIFNNGKFQIFLSGSVYDISSDGTTYNYSGASTVISGQWSCLVFTRTGTTTAIYAGTKTTPPITNIAVGSGSGTPEAGNANTLTIGSASTQYFMPSTAIMDNFLIVPKVMTTGEILNFWNLTKSLY